MPNENTRQKKEEESPLGTFLTVALGVGAAAVAGYAAYKLFSEESPEHVIRPGVSHSGQRSQFVPPPQRRFSTTETEVDAGSSSGEPVCSICCNKLSYVAKKNEEIHVTPCGHVYCYYCIYRWLQTRRSCPTCMSSVSPSETRKIFFS